MNTQNDYLSEFEREFEVDNFSSEYDGENNMSEEVEDELENDLSNESNEEFDSNSEFEMSDEYELDSEQDSESENYLQESSSPDQEFEDRIYSALAGEHESSFEMEQEIDRVLHEMEVEYFWKAAKNLWNKHKNKIMPFAKHLIPGGTLASLVKFAGGDLRSLLKSDLIKKGLSMAANVAMPGVGGAIASGLLNSETPNLNNPRAQARNAVQTAKVAYGNLVNAIPNVRPGNLPNQIRPVTYQAFAMAKKKTSSYKGKKKRIIPIKPGSIVVVRRDRVTIYS